MADVAQGIFAPVPESAELWQMIQTLRGQGERVVVAMANGDKPEPDQHCDRVLVEHEGQFQIKPI